VQFQRSITSCFGSKKLLYNESSESIEPQTPTSMSINGEGDLMTAITGATFADWGDILLPEKSFFSQSTSYLDTDIIRNVSSSAYRAMFIAAHNAEEYSLAWESLETSNRLEKQTRAVKFDRQQAIQQLRQLKSIFQKTFWDGLITPAVKKKSSTFPIFIVGMMRFDSNNPPVDTCNFTVCW